MRSLRPVNRRLCDVTMAVISASLLFARTFALMNRFPASLSHNHQHNGAAEAAFRFPHLYRWDPARATHASLLHGTSAATASLWPSATTADKSTVDFGSLILCNDPPPRFAPAHACSLHEFLHHLAAANCTAERKRFRTAPVDEVAGVLARDRPPWIRSCSLVPAVG